MSFSFAALGAQQVSVEELAQENEASSGGVMPPQKNNLFLIEEVEIKEATSGSVGVNFRFTCVGEKFANRKVFQYVNIVTKDGSINEIGMRQVGALAHAVGFQGVLDNPEELLAYTSIPFCADVVIESQQGYDPQNKLKNWKQAKGQQFQELPMPQAKAQPAPFAQPQMQAQTAQQPARQPVQQQAPAFAQGQAMPAFAMGR